MGTKQSATNLLAAAVLTVLTLSVFSVLREFGPESAVRKFHRAVLSNNRDELLLTIQQPASQSAFSYLAQNVWNFAKVGGRYQIRSLQRNTNQVVAEVEYSYPNGQLIASTLWVVNREKAGWKINVDATAQLWRRGAIR